MQVVDGEDVFSPPAGWGTFSLVGVGAWLGRGPVLGSWGVFLGYLVVCSMLDVYFVDLLDEFVPSMIAVLLSPCYPFHSECSGWHIL